MSKLTKRITAMLLSGMLVIGSVPGSVLAASTDVDPGQTSEIAQEAYDEETSEVPEDVEETAEIQETSEVPMGAGETAESAETSETSADVEESLSEEATAEEEAAVQFYTVTLDANGGYFENEWDDAIGDYAQQAEMVEKHIPVDGTVTAFPVFNDPDGQIMLFAGWSLERDGELVTMGDEEYAPVDNCVLYAVWQAEDAALGDTGEQEAVAENNEQIDAIQESGKEKASEEPEDTLWIKDTDAVEEGDVDERTADSVEYITPEIVEEYGTTDKQDDASVQEKLLLDEEIEKTDGDVPDIAVAEKETQSAITDSSDGEDPLSGEYPEAYEDEETSEELTWILDEEGTLTISGTGEISQYNPSDSDLSKSLIKKVIIEEGITGIGYRAFFGFSSLTNVTLPNSVTMIANSAFQSCKTLTGVTIPNGVKSIGDSAFLDCTSLKSLSIPNSVTWIGAGAFDDCRSLPSITIPDGVTCISSRTFRDCRSLTSITIPDGIMSIGESAFEGCRSLASITISDKITTIGKDAFRYCNSLAIIGALNSEAYRYAIENKIPFIPTDTEQCPILAQGTSNNGLNWSLDIAYNLFISGNGEIPDSGSQSECPWDEYSKTIRSITIDSGITYLGAGAFYEYDNLLEFKSFGAEIIGQQAFSGCFNLKEVKLPNTLKRINEWAFYCCFSISSITIPDSVIHISRYAFDCCNNLKSITLSNNLTSIGSDAFSGCSSLESITIPKGIKKIETNTFRSCNVLTNVTLPEGIIEIESDAFYECEQLSNVFIPSTVENIGYCSFHYYNRRTEQYEPIPGLTITGYSGTYAESYAKENNIPFKSKSVSISEAVITAHSQTYSGKAIKPAVTVKLGNTVLKANTDYTVSYSNNTNAGTATVTITGKVKYKGTKKATFKIGKAAQSITAKAAASSVAVGKTTTVSIAGARGSKSYKSSDTTIASVNSSTGLVTAKKVGTVKITATAAATANYNAASKTVTIKVVPGATTSLTAANQATGIKLTWRKVAGANGYQLYRGSTLIKTITSGNTVTFTDTKANTNGTRYVYKVVAKATTGTSRLSKSVAVYRVSRPALSSVANSAASKMTVKWGKNAKATGYQIQYNTKKTFVSGNRAVTVSGASTVSRVIGGLTKGKTYYVRIRTYKIVGGVKYWSFWSTARSVKISN